MNKLIISISALLIMCGAQASENKPNTQLTDYMYSLLKSCKDKNWCKHYPGGKACDPFFKKLSLDPMKKGKYTVEKKHTDGSAFAHFEIARKPKRPFEVEEILNDKGFVVGVAVTDSHMAKEKMDFVSHLCVKGEKAIKDFDSRFNQSGSNRFSDGDTSCYFWEFNDYRGIPTKRYRCETFQSFAEFKKRMENK